MLWPARIERSLAHVEQLELVSMRVGDDGAQSDFDRKRMDHDATARGDKPLDRGPDVLDKQIDSRVRPLGLQHELSVRLGETQAYLIRTPPGHFVSQTLVKRNAGLEIADRKLQAIELAYERRVRRSTHGRESRSRPACRPLLAHCERADGSRCARTRPEQAHG
jgi:hypothetical protein